MDTQKGLFGHHFNNYNVPWPVVCSVADASTDGSKWTDPARNTRGINTRTPPRHLSRSRALCCITLRYVMLRYNQRFCCNNVLTLFATAVKWNCFKQINNCCVCTSLLLSWQSRLFRLVGERQRKSCYRNSSLYIPLPLPRQSLFVNFD